MKIKRKPGRPTKFNPERAKQIVADVKLGMTWEGAAARARIDVHTLNRWRRLGEDGDRRFAQFVHDLREADSDFERSCILAIRTAEDWRAKAWLVERRFNDRWGAEQKIRHEHGGTPGAPPIKIEAQASEKQKLEGTREAFIAAACEIARKRTALTGGNGNGNGAH